VKNGTHWLFLPQKPDWNSICGIYSISPELSNENFFQAHNSRHYCGTCINPYPDLKYSLIASGFSLSISLLKSLISNPRPNDVRARPSFSSYPHSTHVPPIAMVFYFFHPYLVVINGPKFRKQWSNSATQFLWKIFEKRIGEIPTKSKQHTCCIGLEFLPSQIHSFFSSSSSSFGGYFQ